MCTLTVVNIVKLTCVFYNGQPQQKSYKYNIETMKVETLSALKLEQKWQEISSTIGSGAL